eukprot:TRINITY_DN62_c0_g1_i1.p1 TRINITY_DN62_c0_g1~~TRINITY_DN62_c0_g1_i1.p1  ORF type:complete len:65 (-),score=7.80 TRINITY_DN62_c0_g1_i1:309-503(-)
MLRKTGWEVSYEDYSFNIVAQTLAGSKVFFVASVFSFPDDPDQSVVECVRRKGDSGDFRFSMLI